jgi:hypothetical protein
MCAVEESFKHWIAARRRAITGFSGELILLSVDRARKTASGRKRSMATGLPVAISSMEGLVLSFDQVSVGQLRNCAIEVVASRVRNSGYLLGICGAAGLRRCNSAYRLYALDALGLTKRAPTSGCLGAE